MVRHSLPPPHREIVGHVKRRPIESTAVIACTRSSGAGAGGFSGDRAGLLSGKRPDRRLLRAGDRVQLAADGAGRGCRLGDRNGHGAGAEVRQGRDFRRDLRLQLGAGRNCHVLLLPPGCGERRSADRRLRRGGARDPADAAVRAVSDLHHAVHRHDLGLLLPGSGPGRGPRRAGGAAELRPASWRPRPTASAR